MLRYDTLASRLNAAIRHHFGCPITLIAPSGDRRPIVADRRIEPVVIEMSQGAAVSTSRPFLGLDLTGWTGPLPTTDWTVEIGPVQPDSERWSGRWDITDASQRGGLWLDLELTNRRPL